ncbi:MAG: hypothetical protein QOG94_160 [Solirubrobacteraceae bacterium]|nr:hypothetical protein [Solirubrobacteraceae bacterium]
MKAGASRLRAAGGALDRDQRFAAISAAALIATMFLPWYEKSVVVAGSSRFATDAISAFGAVSFVEAAIFLVAAGVLVIVLTRAEGGRYHLPGGDGTVILGAGLWATALIFYRVFDRPDVSGGGGTVGIQWGFFVAFVAAGALAVAGQRMRAAGRPEPPLREQRPDRRPTPTAHDWSEESTEIVPAPRTEVLPAREPRARRDPDGATRTRRDADGGAGSPRDRAVRREDAELLGLHDPPDAPSRPADGSRTRDRG